MKTISILLKGLEPKYRRMAILAPVTMIGEVLLEVLIPFIMSRIIDIGIANNDINYVVKTGLLMIGAACLSLCCGVLSGKFAATAAQGFGRNIRKRLFERVQDFSFHNIDKFSTASLVTRLTTDVTNTQNTFMMVIRMCIRAPLMLISAAVMACYINMKLATMFMIAVPVLAVALSLIATKAYPRFREMLKKYDKLNSVVQENLTAIRVVKAFVRGKHENEKFDSIADDVRKAQLKAEGIIIFNFPVMMLVMYLCIIAMLWFGGNMIIGGTMQTGELISFISYQSQILMSLMMLSMIFIMLVISKASISRILEVFNEELDITSGGFISDEDTISMVNTTTDTVTANTTGSAHKTDIIGVVRDGSIDFNNVSFSYDKNPDNKVVDDISFHIDSGQTVGIIGGTGSSKSTVVQLIPRLYDVLSGSVKVGGIDVRRYDLTALQNSVAMVLQKNVLFSGTIRDNLRWGNENADDTQIEEACRAAEAHDFIMSFPDGYNTVLGQGGVNVSGGQKQRLCIARALLKKPKILILDDSTSAVDTATDSRIRSSLRENLSETTKIIIAQRIASIKNADTIFVFDDGKLVATGNHEQLLADCPIYQEVYTSQESDNAR